MNKKHVRILLIIVVIMIFAGSVYGQDSQSIQNTISKGASEGLSKLSALEGKTTEIANGTLDWSVILFDTILTAVMTTIGGMPILTDPMSSTVIQTILSIAFTWEFTIIIRGLQKGEFDTGQFGALILNIGLIMCLYGTYDYRNSIPKTQDLWAKADSVGNADGIKTLDKDLFNIVKYFGSQVSAGFKPDGQDVFRIVALAQSESVIKKWCEKEAYDSILACRQQIFSLYENEGGALTSKGKEDVTNLVRERDYGNDLNIPQQILFFIYSLLYASSFVEAIRLIMAIFVTVVNIIGIVLANVVMLGSLLEASMMLIILKIIYPFLIVRTQRDKVMKILRSWVGFALVGMICTICSFVTDIMLMTGMNILTGSTASAAINTILIGVLVSPLSFGFVAVVKVLLISILALKISLIKNVGKIAQGLMSLQIDGLANLATGAGQAMLGMVAVGAGVVAGGMAGMNVMKGMLGGKKPPISPATSNLSGGDPGMGGGYNPPPENGTANLASGDEDEVQDVNVKNGSDVGKNEVKTGSSNQVNNPRNALNIPEVDENGRMIRPRDSNGRFTKPGIPQITGENILPQEKSSGTFPGSKKASSEHLAEEGSTEEGSPGISKFGRGNSSGANGAGEKAGSNPRNFINKEKIKDKLAPEITKYLKDILDAIKENGTTTKRNIRSLDGEPSASKSEAKSSARSKNDSNDNIDLSKAEKIPDPDISDKESQTDLQKLMSQGMDKKEAEQFVKFKKQLDKKQEEEKANEKLTGGQRFIKKMTDAYQDEVQKIKPAQTFIEAGASMTSLKDGPFEAMSKIQDAQKKVYDLDRKKLLSMFDLNKDKEIDIDEVVKYFKDREMDMNPLEATAKDAQIGEATKAKKEKAAIELLKKQKRDNQR